MAVLLPAERLAHLTGMSRLVIAFRFLCLNTFTGMAILETVVTHIGLGFPGVRIVIVTILATILGSQEAGYRQCEN